MLELLARAWCSLVHGWAWVLPHRELGLVLVCVTCRRIKAVAS
jgi:hypothetical protein